MIISPQINLCKNTNTMEFIKITGMRNWKVILNNDLIDSSTINTPTLETILWGKSVGKTKQPMLSRSKPLLISSFTCHCVLSCSFGLVLLADALGKEIDAMLNIPWDNSLAGISLGATFKTSSKMISLVLRLNNKSNSCFEDFFDKLRSRQHVHLLFFWMT